MITLKTSMGDIVIALDFENTPQSADNFLHYARNNFYNGTIFHRVINGFMIQFGGFEPGMVQRATDRAPVKNEADKSSYNQRGAVAFARTTDPDSATSQLFINVVDNHFLNYTSSTLTGWGYCTFGKVISGMDVVDEIRKLPTISCAGHQDVPVEDVIIETVIIDESALQDAKDKSKEAALVEE